MGDDVRARLGEVLAAHRLYGEDGDDTYECGCGATSPPEALEEYFGELLWHEAHVAAILAARAAAPDGLREAVEGLAADLRTKNGTHWCEWGCDVAIGNRLRDILAAHPAPGGGA